MAAPVAQKISADFNVNGCIAVSEEGKRGYYHGGEYARQCG